MAQLCEHFKHDFLKTIPVGARIAKEECSQCYLTWDSEGGLDICLTCFNTGCSSTHSSLHSLLHQHPISLHLQRSLVPKDKPSSSELTKLAVVQTEDADEYILHSNVKCHTCNISFIKIDDEKVQKSTAAILNATSAKVQEEIKTWELEYTTCKHTETLVQQPLDQSLPEKPMCQICQLTENLWICLVCGQVGCGRSQVGGQAGYGHALAHTTESGHSVVAKLGTITPEGQADVYCYACDEERLDPHLPLHLLNLGIHIEHQKKTEASMVERQLKQNMEFTMTTKDGHELPSVSGPWLTGLSNLGNSCYLNVTLQLLATLPSFRDLVHSTHMASCMLDPLDCWPCQWIKWISGMAQGQILRPVHLKSLICRGHPDFSSMKQQDVSEFLSFLFQEFETKKISELPALSLPFRYQSIQRLECSSCHGFSFTETTTDAFTLMLPPSELLRAFKQSDENSPSSLNAIHCLEQMLKENVDYQCPHCLSTQTGIRRTGFQTFPEMLIVVTQRFVYDGWVPRKSEIHLQWPATLLDLKPFYLEKDANAIVLEKPEVTQLISFGFEKEKAIKALQHCQWNVEAALNALMDQPELFETNSESISMLVSMGFSKPMAEKALTETKGSLEASIEWLFQNHTPNDTPKTTQTSIPSSTQYQLVGFINHKGSSMHCGHYISHYLDFQQRWILFNDEKVVLAKDVEEMCSTAYIYIFKRV